MRFDEFVSVIEKASDEFGSFGTKIPLSRLIIPQSEKKSNINPIFLIKYLKNFIFIEKVKKMCYNYSAVVCR